MRTRPEQSKKQHLWHIGLVMFALLGTIVTPSPSLAVSGDTQVNVSVQSGPARLTIEQPAGSTLNSAGDSVIKLNSVKLAGEVRRISQITVYIDNQYNSTTSLAIGAMRYELAVSIPVGRHVVRLEANDPDTNTPLTASIAIVYEPDVAAEVVESAQNVVSDTGKAVVDTNEIAANQVNLASSSGPMKQVVDWAYAGLVAVDILPSSAAAAQQSIGAMALRLSVVTVGVALAFHPWYAYRLVISRLPFVPVTAVATPALRAPIRIGGIALLAVSFLLFI